MVLILAGLILALVGVVAGLILYLKSPPRPSLVAIVLDQYSDPRIPAAPWAERDREGLAALGWQNVSTFTSQQKTLLLKELQGLSQHSSREPVVVYLRGYAVGTDEGQVALLPADARVDDPATWLPFRDVLEAVRACPAPHKLLLLDLAAPWTSPEVGVLRNNIAQLLRAELEVGRDLDPNLQVICACSPGQVSLASEEMGHTVFMYFLLQGLAGRADGCLPGKEANGEVSVQEIAAYLREKTDLWAWQNRRARQIPFLVGPQTDYSLTFTLGMTPPPEDPLAEAYPAFLRKGWEQREQWKASLGKETPGALLRQLDLVLLDAEERWRAGESADRIDPDLARERKALERQQEEPDSDRPLPGRRSLVRLAAREEPKVGNLTDHLRQLKELARLHALTTVATPNPMDVTRFQTAKDAFLKPFLEKPADVRKAELSWIVYQAAAMDPSPQLDAYRLWLSLLHGPGEPVPDYVEIHYLARLTEWGGKKESWPAMAAPAALRLVGEAMEAEGAPRRWRGWIRQTEQEAAGQRREAEQAFHSAQEGTAGQVRAKMQEAAQSYREINTHVRTLSSAHRVAEEAAVLLPAYASYLLQEPARETVWLSAVQSAQALEGLLEKPAEASNMEEVLRRISRLAVTLQDNLDSLSQPGGADMLRRWMEQRSRLGVTDCVQMRAALRLPLLSAADRVRLWSEWRGLARRLHQGTLSALEKAAAGQAPRDVPPTWNEARAIADENQRGLLRARASLALVQLAGATSTERLEEALHQVSRSLNDTDAWHRLRDELARAWKNLSR